MKIFKRTLLAIVLLLIAVVITGYFILNNIKKAALPDYSEDVQIPGLTGEVTILRDSFAIPHIYAKNETDLYRAVGFCMAQDRLWQMDLLRRVTQGRLSEILGKDQLNTDLLMRALRIPEKSEKVLAKSSPEITTILKAFSEGINFYLENYPLPPEFKILGYQPDPWQPVHSVNLIGYLAWDLTSGWGTELLLHQINREITPEQLQELIPDMKNHPTAIFPDFNAPAIPPEETLLSANNKLKELGAEIFRGSNNWAVSGKKSKTGKPLLANDMHLGLFAPGVWYQMHHVTEGSLNVTGVVLPGQPFVICGHNDSIAWGMTNVYVDDLDFYTETLNNDSTKYLLDGQWKDLLIREETIQTKEEEAIKETLKFTHRGPLVNRFKNETETALSIRWLGNEYSDELRSVFLLNRANNWGDFRHAVKTFSSVSQNIVYADAAGNIGLQTCAGVPLRKGSGIEIYPGDTSLYDWTGFVPFEELPFEFNPERGYVSSANNKTVPEDYPYHIGTWFAIPDRIDRIRDMLEEIPQHGVADFKRIQGDIQSKKAEKWTPVFLEALETKTSWDTTRQAAFQKLKDWNLVLSRESQAASIFEILFRKVAENLVKDDLPQDLFHSFMGERSLVENLMVHVLSAKKSHWIDDKNTPDPETWNDIVIRAFQETTEDLKQQSGPNVEDWQWGKIHTFTVSHPLGVVSALDKALNLNRGPFEMPGSFHTVCPYSYSYNNLYKVTNGASHRHIFDLANWDASETIIPTGTSGIPASDFYLDQTNRYLNNLYHDDLFSREKVEEKKLFQMKLLPAGS
ncbi:penicillin acylase family protein [Mariniphaga sediminis]|uniref:Penicillin acylase family protein n=1 Tax=Mariniphaga sediminis TaxID=1628158 RepID=A0A399CWB7_9BACT|nr:penicillin acylase family protein [Mariniphaga sediminis]RIH64035.1 penicillin acylase family protein [Mariniphaga sediminis]